MCYRVTSFQHFPNDCMGLEGGLLLLEGIAVWQMIYDTARQNTGCAGDVVCPKSQRHGTHVLCPITVWITFYAYSLDNRLMQYDNRYCTALLQFCTFYHDKINLTCQLPRNRPESNSAIRGFLSLGSSGYSGR